MGSIISSIKYFVEVVNSLNEYNITATTMLGNDIDNTYYFDESNEVVVITNNINSTNDIIPYSEFNGFLEINNIEKNAVLLISVLDQMYPGDSLVIPDSSQYLYALCFSFGKNDRQCDDAAIAKYIEDQCGINGVLSQGPTNRTCVIDEHLCVSDTEFHCCTSPCT